ncbi:MAG: hypothetical protein AABX14_01610 [Candidatus Aenigmatarchaeota archaeon]
MSNKSSGDTILLALFAILIVIALVNVVTLTSISMNVQKGSTKPAIVYAALDLTEIQAPVCDKCYSMSNTIANIKTQSVNLTESIVYSSSSDAQSLISKYGINKLPALVITGEINKTATLTGFWSQLGSVKNGAVVIEAQPPYYSVRDSAVVGLVTLTRVVDSSCKLCTDLESLVKTFENAGVVISSDTSVEYNSADGKTLTNTYGLREIPAVIVSKNILEYPAMTRIWPQLNATEKNNNYALHLLQPPYRDLAMNRVVGLVDIIYLNDSTCSECYDVMVHKQIVGGSFGAALVNETLLDISSVEGKALVSKYSIKSVPTFVMSPEAKYYSILMEVWPGVGTQDSNGWYVFRNITQMQSNYKDLETGNVVTFASG